MAIPYTWRMLSQRTRWTITQGREIVQTWEGPAGENSQTFETWLTNFAGYTSLEYEHKDPMDDGDAVMTVQIGFAATEAGAIRQPGDPEWGLISRSWRLHSSDAQLPLETFGKVSLLADADPVWPIKLRKAVEAYNKAVVSAIEEWGFAPNTSPPDLPIQSDLDAMIAACAPLSADAFLRAHAVRYARILQRSENPDYDVSQNILSKVEQVTSWSTITVSHENKGRWHSWAALRAAEPSLVGVGLVQTARLEDLIWLKKAPDVQASTGGNYELTQDYLGAIRPTGEALADLEWLFDPIL